MTNIMTKYYIARYIITTNPCYRRFFCELTIV